MTTISERCLAIQHVITTAKENGQPIPDFSGELAQMETELRHAGLWREDAHQPGHRCAWWRVCRCTHVGCSGGFLIEQTADRIVRGIVYGPEARRCPTCFEASQRKQKRP